MRYFGHSVCCVELVEKQAYSHSRTNAANGLFGGLAIIPEMGVRLSTVSMLLGQREPVE